MMEPSMTTQREFSGSPIQFPAQHVLATSKTVWLQTGAVWVIVSLVAWLAWTVATESAYIKLAIVDNTESVDDLHQLRKDDRAWMEAEFAKFSRRIEALEGAK